MAPTEAARAADARRRRAALQERLTAADIDAAVVTTEPHFTYLTGYTTPSWANRARPIALVVPGQGEPTAILSQAEATRLLEWDSEIVPGGYIEPSDSEAAATGPGYVDSTLDAISASLGKRVGKLAIERRGPAPPGLPHDAIESLGNRLSAEMTDLDSIVWPLRLRKSEVEAACLREAAAALGRCFASFGEAAEPGMTERELEVEFIAAAARSGAERLGYVVVVAGAGRAALGPPTDRVWGPGELLTVDAGLVCCGYWADYCRLYVAEEPSPAQESAYLALTEAIWAGREAIRPGVAPGDPSRAMTSRLSGGPEFGRLGHGIGLELAEPPSIHPADPTTLEAGMTLCVEPSGWTAESGYVVAEEMVIVTADGAELLSPAFPDSLQVVAT